jgi:hypothetical protein
MSATYLDITNELIREINEISLSSGNFNNALGIQQHVKDCVNRAYLDIVNEEPQWPFLSVGDSGTTDPFYGNVSINTVAGTRWYELKPTSSSLTTDYGYIDWDNFYITTIGVAGETAPYTSENLKFLTIEEWKDYYRLAENTDDADSQNWGQPSKVIKSPDNRKFGLSAIPDKEYKIWFYAYALPTELSLYSDEIIFPNTYKPVLLARARYYLHQFKENNQSAAFAQEDYKRGLRLMKSNLMSPAPIYMKDDRVRFI